MRVDNVVVVAAAVRTRFPASGGGGDGGIGVGATARRAVLAISVAGSVAMAMRARVPCLCGKAARILRPRSDSAVGVVAVSGWSAWTRCDAHATVAEAGASE